VRRALASLETLYLARSLSALFDPINAAFRGGAAPPTAAAGGAGVASITSSSAAPAPASSTTAAGGADRRRLPAGPELVSILRAMTTCVTLVLYRQRDCVHTQRETE
jgi:hypothetical protein